MFHCERCGIRFSTGALSGSRSCPRCRLRDGVDVTLTWEPLLAAREAATAARDEARRAERREPVGSGEVQRITPSPTH
jgi:hypothetical protein